MKFLKAILMKIFKLNSSCYIVNLSSFYSSCCTPEARRKFSIKTENIYFSKISLLNWDVFAFGCSGFDNDLCLRNGNCEKKMN